MKKAILIASVIAIPIFGFAQKSGFSRHGILFIALAYMLKHHVAL